MYTNILFFTATLSLSYSDMNWHQDLTNEINIGVSGSGYSRVILDCDADHMAFIVHLEEEFQGVIYTRGTFHSKNKPCFTDATNGKEFALKFAYKDCGTKYDSDVGAWVNTVVVQHDDELIFPGDLAFSLRCHDQAVVNASMPGILSRISEVDPDPGSNSVGGFEKYAASTSNVVTLTPAKLQPPNSPLLKQEL